MIIVDVGACVGEYTDHCLKTYDVEKIIMVEPLKENLDYLTYKYSKGGTLGKKTFIIGGAISDYNGSGDIYPKIKFDRIADANAVKHVEGLVEMLLHKTNESDNGFYSGIVTHKLAMPQAAYYGALENAGCFIGNDGSCLNLTEEDLAMNNDMLNSFYDPFIRKSIEVGTVSAVMAIAKIDKIDILKLDVEGTEYKILKNVLDENLHEKIDRIFFEDHLDKRAGMLGERSSVLQRIKELGIEDKFFTQYEELTYDIPLADTEMWKSL